MLQFIGSQAQVVETCELIVRIHLGDERFQLVGLPKQNASEVEIVPQCAYLVVNNRRLLTVRKMIRIDHGSVGHLHHLYHAFLPQIDPLDIGFEADHRIRAVRFFCNLFDCLGRAYSARQKESSCHSVVGIIESLWYSLSPSMGSWRTVPSGSPSARMASSKIGL